MSLGLARDSMLNLAELAAFRMDDGSEGGGGGRRGGGRVGAGYDSDGDNVTLVEVEDGGGGSERLPEDGRPSVMAGPSSAPADATGPHDRGDDDGGPPADGAGLAGSSGESSQQLEEEPKTSLTPPSDDDANAAPPSSSLPSKAGGDRPPPPGSSDGGSVDSSTQNGRAVGQYSGFVNDYQDFDDSYSFHDSYSGYGAAAGGGGGRVGSSSARFVHTHFDPYSLRSQQQQEAPWWCCLFPWVAGGDRRIESDEVMIATFEETGGGDLRVGTESLKRLAEAPGAAASSSSSNNNNSPDGPGSSRNQAGEDDEVSTGSDVFGEKLSDKDRQAVLARLRLAQPDAERGGNGSGNSSHGKKNGGDVPAGGDHPSGTGNVGSAPNGVASRALKSIMRRSSTLVNNLKSLDGQSGGGGGGGGPRRRSLFPSYEKQPDVKKDLHATFAPMARVVTIKSLKDMDAEEKAGIWWQKPDYEEFRRTGRMITKAMLEGGSEVWLATNQSWQLPNQGKAATFQRASSLAERQAAFRKGDVNAKITYEETRDKWWHKFGHSRRGLEHIASIDEGRQRQANVRTSIRAVLDEQRRQRAFHREDPDKFRTVYLQSTSWAKDLSLASGASDADAVAKDFDDESRRSREFYLIKFSRANAPTNAPKSTKSNVPAFMKPMEMMPVPANILDANTISQIRYRQKQQTATAATAASRKPSSSAGAAISAGAAVSAAAPSVGTGRLAREGSAAQIPLKDGWDDSSKENMAKKAAGYASGDAVANMAAVLSGMGPIPKGVTAAVGGP